MAGRHPTPTNPRKSMTGGGTNERRSITDSNDEEGDWATFETVVLLEYEEGSRQGCMVPIVRANFKDSQLVGSCSPLPVVSIREYVPGRSLHVFARPL
jgi:hypothetical protein